MGDFGPKWSSWFSGVGWQIGWQMISLDPHFPSLFVLLSMKKSIQIRHHSYRSAIRTCLAIKIHNKSIVFFFWWSSFSTSFHNLLMQQWYFLAESQLVQFLIASPLGSLGSRLHRSHSFFLHSWWIHGENSLKKTSFMFRKKKEVPYSSWLGYLDISRYIKIYIYIYQESPPWIFSSLRYGAHILSPGEVPPGAAFAAEAAGQRGFGGCHGAPGSHRDATGTGNPGWDAMGRSCEEPVWLGKCELTRCRSMSLDYNI